MILQPCVSPLNFKTLRMKEVFIFMFYILVGHKKRSNATMTEQTCFYGFKMTDIRCHFLSGD